MIEIASQV